eukprot:GGOE01005147.1.p1 GENE.GGOE01005147.1~~GGOE01005147.1.p1  ORF type:complete len:220 (-),score=42.29 GGOE01005147.1:2298-2933(-)
MASTSFASISSTHGNSFSPVAAEHPVDACDKKFHWNNVVSNKTSFCTASRRTALVHSPYTFTGPYEVVLPPRKEKESVGTGSLCFGSSNFSPKPPVCTSHMCNAAFAFHISTCILAQVHNTQHFLPRAPESPASLSPASSVGSLSPEPRSPLSGPAESSRPPSPLPTPTGKLNLHHKMLRALRQDGNHQLQLCGLQGKIPMALEGRSTRDV